MNMWQEGTILPINEVKIRNGMVFGTCPILVEGNEYIFRYTTWNIFTCFHFIIIIEYELSTRVLKAIGIIQYPPNHLTQWLQK